MLYLPRMVFGRDRQTLEGDQMQQRLGVLWRSYGAPLSPPPKEKKPRRID
ncbi:MAG: hypothetical protein AB1508_15520 [Pseudomonadota bacterium]